jgi:hypothetical protein
MSNDRVRGVAHRALNPWEARMGLEKVAPADEAMRGLRRPSMTLLGPRASAYGCGEMLRHNLLISSCLLVNRKQTGDYL